ncbi:Rhodanese-like domain-containing protein [Xylariales sp. PMI_506]|nr:Rhodanese-like domain-containing protein [Xylariales sp. PMI_506]
MSMAYQHFASYLVSPEELHRALRSEGTSSALSSSRIILLSAASFPPGDGRRVIDSFRERRIPGARFFDLDEVADKTSGLPHTLPELASVTSVPRAAWTFKVCGHAKVHVLNNFKLWVEQGYPVETESPSSPDTVPQERTYPVPELDKGKVIDFDQADMIFESGGLPQILDARPYGHWSGKTPEPRAELSSGHIPGSTNVPMAEFLDPETKTFLSPERLGNVFQGKKVDPNRPVITTCGSGMTAAVIDAALTASVFINESDGKLYDGSWL